MNATDDYQYERSRKDLAPGILKQAALDLRRFHAATSGVEREFYLDAYRWIISEDCSWPFSFLNVCQLLNLVPETIREEMLGDLSLGAFGYWMKRGGRFASTLRTYLFRPFARNRSWQRADTNWSSPALQSE